MNSGRVIKANTNTIISAIAQGCCERAASLRKNMRDKAVEDVIIAEVNNMALNYFIGATACAAALGIPELEMHLKHVLLTEVQPWGMIAVEKIAVKK